MFFPNYLWVLFCHICYIRVGNLRVVDGRQNNTESRRKCAYKWQKEGKGYPAKTKKPLLKSWDGLREGKIFVIERKGTLRGVLFVEFPRGTVLGVLHFETEGGELVTNAVAGGPVFVGFGFGA